MTLTDKDKQLIAHDLGLPSFDFMGITTFGFNFQCFMGEDYQIIIYGQGVFIQPNHIQYKFTLKHKGKVVLHNKQVGIPQGQKLDFNGLMLIVECCLSYASLEADDVEDDFFDDYSPRELTWRDSYAEPVGLLAYDLSQYSCDDTYRYEPNIDNFFMYDDTHEVMSIINAKDFNTLANMVNDTLNA